MSEPQLSHASSPFDIAVIGGGVVGCAMARRMTLDGASVVLIEKSTDILAGASKGNSAILHTGFDAPPGSLEHECIQSGYAEYLSIREGLGLPLLETGAIVAAWTEEQEEKLSGIFDKAKINKVDGVRMLSGEEVLRREPHLAPTVRAGVLVEGEHVIDPWSAPYAYLRQAVDNGAHVLFSAEVLGREQQHGAWQLHTTKGEVRAKIVINCAGLYGDVVDQRVLGKSNFTIKPRKGQFVVFDKAASALLSSIILPVPTDRTKGIVLCRTIFGNVLVGPTAEDQKARDKAPVDRQTLQALIEKAGEMLPGLRTMPVTATYAGLRPATEHSEYQIIPSREENWITVGGIRSTGLTGALGIAQHISKLLSENFCWSSSQLTQPLTNAVPNLSEYAVRDWAKPGHGEIVCHCELVTRREVENALAGPLPARSLSALKRRTRATLGRCQGFYCSARLSELADNFFESPLSVEMVHD